MEILRNRQSLSDYIAAVKKEGKKIGFAPTMGALHDGHMSLYKEARKDNDIVISSVFVNPTQFNNPDDLKKYPRTEENDIAMLEKAGVDAVYIPTIEDIYPAKAESKHYDFGGIENEMEGKFRPGHFDGVGTVVSELFRQVQPDNAYFGEKDYQQLAIIKKLVEIEKFPIKIHGVPIYRAENGLALSSRNARLSEEERNGATLIYKTLVKVNEWFRVISIPEIKKRVEEIFEQSDYELEYFLIADEETLKETDFFYKDKNYRAFIVVFVGEVRLIDNMHMD
ncbi:pantoate--beta-alanine ligase [Elizabethkingia anophelis]|uniref:Pantothenate synthetase n=1 Tax=Elizabethkingia anophelis R26 TaxID=1246994 RepID=A0ABM6MSJ7_9FLAO|nr:MULTISPECIES: pantoate--beta-alanine ligase [Elizabethkingia]AQW91249.1 pantoate--beta-alanine ligase [Elizabethkingia anophelis]ATC36097.1 pantoate--beta-alanine ligase [Elizabethkingia anophelis R26]ATC39774.1 pantoate--beta-alanine ligase [Elizabethkingia anophelis Ag1]ATC43453.1 pantoate--beta-alanine ligase [Elizabethkingia anophelis]ATC47129.1 pantoate--beta-alanine ligase [Elizabethkingia anophelis]